MISRDKNSSKLKTITTHVDQTGCSTNPLFLKQRIIVVVVKQVFPYNFWCEKFLFFYRWFLSRFIFRILKHGMLILFWFFFYWLKHFSCQTNMPKLRITFATVYKLSQISIPNLENIKKTICVQIDENVTKEGGAGVGAQGALVPSPLGLNVEKKIHGNNT